MPVLTKIRTLYKSARGENSTLHLSNSGNRLIFKDNDQSRFIVNSSRGIIYASSGEDYAVKAREVAKELRDELN